METIIRRSIYVVAVCCSATVSAVDKNSGDTSQAILERLEQKLLRREEGTLSFDKDPVKTSSPSQTTRLNYEGQEIKAEAPQLRELEELEKAIVSLEKETENLSRDVQTSRQAILQQAAQTGQVFITTRFSQGSASFRTLRVKLDGFTIYETAGSQGFWQSPSELPLFQGPLQPGKHKLEYEARLVMKQEQAPKTNSDAAWNLDETFDFEVPEGKSQKNWSVTVELPEAGQGKAQAKLENK